MYEFIDQGDIIGVFLEGGPANFENWLNEPDDYITETTEGYDIGVDLSIGGNGNNVPGSFIAANEEIRFNSISVKNWVRLTVRTVSMAMFYNVKFESMSDERDRLYLYNAPSIASSCTYDEMLVQAREADQLVTADFTNCRIELFDSKSVQRATDWTMDALTTVRNIKPGAITLQHTGAAPTIAANNVGPITLQQL